MTRQLTHPNAAFGHALGFDDFLQQFNTMVILPSPHSPPIRPQQSTDKCVCRSNGQKSRSSCPAGPTVSRPWIFILSSPGFCVPCTTARSTFTTMRRSCCSGRSILLMFLCALVGLLRGKTGLSREVMIFSWYWTLLFQANVLQRVFNYNTQERVVSFEAHPEYKFTQACC